MLEPIPWFVEPVRSALAARPLRRVKDLKGQRPAAVMLMLFDLGGEPALVLTKRSELVRHHKGEISFPGGRMDPDDETLERAAIRETVEELGVDERDLTIIGELDDLETFVSGFVVRPFVAHVPAREVYEHSQDEIDEVIFATLPQLCEVAREAEWRSGEHRFTTHVFDVRGHVIWGMTGRILRDFLDVVAAPLGYSIGPMREGSIG